MENEENFRKFIEKMKPMMTISRLPVEVMEEFKKMAKERFNDDYGITLTWILKELERLKDIESISNTFGSMITELEERVKKLESKPEEEVRKIRTVSGKDIFVKR